MADQSMFEALMPSAVAGLSMNNTEVKRGADAVSFR